jgi:hypothetical protein
MMMKPDTEGQSRIGTSLRVGLSMPTPQGCGALVLDV